jgi:polyhydroxybutyrate depolymerase
VAASFEDGRLSVVHDGVTRTAIVDAAPGLQDAPLLIVLHGGIGRAAMVRRRARIGLAAQGWAVAFPEALDDWSDGRTWPWGGRISDVDDVGFLRTLVTDLAARGTVDPERVFIAGPSIGGMMTLRVLCEAPELAAGFIVAIAALPRGYDCPPGEPRPVMVLHGTADTIVPPEGGRIGGSSILIRERGSVQSIDATMALLAERNACGGFTEAALPDTDPSDGTTTVRRRYEGCDAPLEHLVVEGGGHTWPGDRPFRMGQSLVGATSQDFSATRAVERFVRDLDAAMLAQTAGEPARRPTK